MKIYCIEIGEYDDEWQFVLKVDNDRIEVLHAMDGLDHDIMDTVEVDEIENFVKL